MRWLLFASMLYRDFIMSSQQQPASPFLVDWDPSDPDDDDLPIVWWWSGFAM